ncbi:MAG: PEP-CTERM sorting domain-containing protein [Fimbriimonadaceae bacterium]|nr:PEP-CTERM sorting domain-containing protein [Fimbriimonadaceae bacterium]
MKRTFLVAFAVVGAVAANAQVNYGTNFDPATYAPGLLNGQDGWVAGSGSSNLPTVTNNVSFSSPQSVMLVGNPGTGSTFNSSGHLFGAGLPSAGTMLLTASAMVRVDSIGADRYFGIAFGASALATGGRIGIFLGGNGLRGGGGSYASFNSLAGGLLQSRTTADFLGRWIRVSMTADRSSAVNNMTFTFSGLDTTGGAATESFTRSADLSLINLTHVQVVSDWSSSSAHNGLAFVDNAQFGANPVPEPATMAVLGIGAMALIRRRKKA